MSKRADEANRESTEAAAGRRAQIQIATLQEIKSEMEEEGYPVQS